MSAFAALCALCGLAAVGVVTVVNLAGKLLAHAWNRYSEHKPKQPAKPHKSRPVMLIVKLESVAPGVMAYNRYWYFDEPESDTVDPVTGERLMNGWTNAELIEIASRRKEWGI